MASEIQTGDVPMFAKIASSLAFASVSGLAASSVSASELGFSRQGQTAPAAPASPAANGPFQTFTPTTDPIRHRIDYDIWDFALRNIVVPMGTSNRKGVGRDSATGTRIRQGHKSRYRLEGSLVGFYYFNRETVASFTEYRRDLEAVGTKLDISRLPRNEQLAFWFNLHNVALLEQIALEWPVREPRELEIDGVPLDESKFITVGGVEMSLCDIRENIVFANWRSPKVIYGFWRGEIGGPALEPMAYTGANVGSLLDIAAADYINSLRGTQKRGKRLDVSTLYEEARPFYFPDFDRDLRAHLSEYANEDVQKILSKTDTTTATVKEWAIADMSGGARPANYLFVNDGSSARVPTAITQLLRRRSNKLLNMKRRGEGTGRVIFSNIDLPGDPPNKNAVY
ncbi:MAG: DUF547 domain-containing protein [Pseudomonadota bacterium]